MLNCRLDLQIAHGLWIFDASSSLAFGPGSSQEVDWDSTLFRLINDSVMGDLFHDYLKDKRSLEHLLFWLDATIYKNSKNIPQTTMRVYMALTYFMRNAPLSISVNSETKNDVTTMLTCTAPVDSRMLDDALLQIQWILKLHLFNFMKLNPVKSWKPRPRMYLSRCSIYC